MIIPLSGKSGRVPWNRHMYTIKHEYSEFLCGLMKVIVFNDNWSILSQHQPDFKSVQRAFFLETKLVSYIQATDSDCWYNHHTALTGVGLTSYPYHFRLDSQEEAQPKKVESAIPHKLIWVLKVSPNVQHSIFQEALAYHLTRAVTAVVPSRTLTSSATCVTSTTILALRMTHHPCLWTTMCGSDDEFKLKT